MFMYLTEKEKQEIRFGIGYLTDVLNETPETIAEVTINYIDRCEKERRKK